MLEYKGYVGHAEYDAGAHAFHGFINDDLQVCGERGEDPDKPVSGLLMLRLASELHRQVSVQARDDGKILNPWIAERREKATWKTIRADSSGNEFRRVRRGDAWRPGVIRQAHEAYRVETNSGVAREVEKGTPRWRLMYRFSKKLGESPGLVHHTCQAKSKS